jgi:hypothetical protein
MALPLGLALHILLLYIHSQWERKLVRDFTRSEWLFAIMQDRGVKQGFPSGQVLRKRNRPHLCQP